MKIEIKTMYIYITLKGATRMALLLDDGRIVQDVKEKHMFLTTNEICTILDCSRGFVVKNFRDDLGLKFSDLRGETYKIREQIIAERGGERRAIFPRNLQMYFIVHRICLIKFSIIQNSQSKQGLLTWRVFSQGTT